MSASTLRIASRRPARLAWMAPVALAATWLLGCTGEVSHNSGGPMSIGTAGANSSGGSSAVSSGGTAMVSQECAQGVHPGRAPVRRLTRFEYNNAVRDLFGD